MAVEVMEVVDIFVNCFGKSGLKAVIDEIINMVKAALMLRGML